MEKRIDLHVHTTASDGADSPAGVVRLAGALDLASIAVTDHDSVAGVAAAMAEGEKLGVEVIPGIEVSADYRGNRAHILGLFIDPGSGALRPVLDWAVNERVSRNEKIVAALAADGFDISLAALKAAYPDSVLGRPHMAEHLVKKGYAQSVKEVFDRWLGEGRPYYRDRGRLSMEEAVRAIRAAGGLAAVAHPLQYGYDEPALRAYLTAAKAAGCEALEAYYSEHSPAQQAYVLALAEQYGMLPSGGSDYHGSRKPHIQLGTGIGGGLCVPCSVLEGLKARRK